MLATLGKSVKNPISPNISPIGCFAYTPLKLNLKTLQLTLAFKLKTFSAELKQILLLKNKHICLKSESHHQILIW